MKVYKIRNKITGQFSSGLNHLTVMWDPNGKIWLHKGHLSRHIKYVNRIDGEHNYQYGDCEIISFNMEPINAESI